MLRLGIGILGTMIFLSGIAPTSAMAGEERRICGPRDQIIQRLATRFDERQSAIGMTGGGSLVELYVSPDGTWTFVHTTTEGFSCLLAAGQDWEDLPPMALETPATPS